MVVFYLRVEKRFNYIIYTVNSNGNVIELSNNQYFKQVDAVLWARDFITSFPQSCLRLYFEENKGV